MRKSYIIVLLMAAVMLVTAAFPALAQESDTDQLSALFQMFMQQVQKTTAVPTLEPVFEPTATLTPIPDLTDITDVDSYAGALEGYSDAELLQLLQLLMQQLDGSEPQAVIETEVPAAAPEETPTPVAAPEMKVFDIYENKKLIIGNMPSYMFIRPTAVPQSDNNPNTPEKKKDGNPDPGPSGPSVPSVCECPGRGFPCGDGRWSTCDHYIDGTCGWSCAVG